MPKPNPILRFLSTLPTKLDCALFLITHGLFNEPDMERMRLAALELRRQNRSKEALKLCNRALALSPSNYAILQSRGELLESLGRKDEATADYSRSLSLRIHVLPGDPDTFYYRGFYNGHLGQYEDAIADFNRALTFNPNNVMVLHNRAIAYSKLDMTEDALDDFNRACKLSPDEVELLEDRACLNYKLDHDEEAIRDLTHINTLVAPTLDHIERQRILIAAFRNLGKYEQALEICNSMLTLAPDNPSSLQFKAHILHMLGRYGEALTLSDRTVELCPDNHAFRTYRSHIHYDAQHLEASLSDANAVLLQQPENAEALSVIALIHARWGQIDEGKRFLARARACADALEPSGFSVQLSEAGFLSLSGETYLAISILTEVVQNHRWAQTIIARDPIYTNLHSLPEWRALIADNVEA